MEEENRNITSDDSSSVFHPRTEHCKKGDNTELDSNSDGEGGTTPTNNEEVDDCDLGKSAFLSDPNSPIVENSISKYEQPYDIVEDLLAWEERETMYLGDNRDWNCWEEYDIKKEIPGQKGT